MYDDLKVFRQLYEGITIIGGDFNFVTQHKDTSTSVIRKPRTATEMRRIMDELNLIDAWDIIMPNTNKEHAHTYYNDGYSARLDRIYVERGALDAPIIKRLTRPRLLGDHNMVSLELQSVKTSKPLPKHPDYFLNDPRYNQELCDRIRDTILNNTSIGERYQNTEPDQDDVNLIQQLRENGEWDPKEIEANEVSELKQRFHDASARVLNSKIDNLFRKIADEELNEDIPTIQDYMDSLVNALDEEQQFGLLESILTDIISFSGKYRKRHKQESPVEKNKTETEKP